MNNTIIISILVSLAVNEFLGVTDWLAYRLTHWAAMRWKAKTGFDHLDEWCEDLRHSPGRLFRVISSAWLLLGTFVGMERLTLNLPSLWRISLPLRNTINEALRAVVGLIGALERRAAAKLFTGFRYGRHVAIIMAIVTLLPRNEQHRYLEEWIAELNELDGSELRRWVLQLVLVSPQLAISLRLPRKI